MKRIGLFLLAVVMVLGFVGCNNGDSDPNPVGTWTVSYLDTPSTAVWHIYANGTFIVNDHVGEWSVNGDAITLTRHYSNAITIYGGTFTDNNTMSGTMETTWIGGILHGSWSAIKTADTP